MARGVSFDQHSDIRLNSINIYLHVINEYVRRYIRTLIDTYILAFSLYLKKFCSTVEKAVHSWPKRLQI